MLERESGSIINIASLSTFVALYEVAAYSASKAAVGSLTKSLAIEWASRGVRVNVLVPGSIATDMILPSDPDRRAAFIAENEGESVFGRLGDPDDLVGAAIFLASDASAYMTGRSVFVDGGRLR